MPSNCTPIDCYLQFVDDEILDTIVAETNRNAEHVVQLKRISSPIFSQQIRKDKFTRDHRPQQSFEKDRIILDKNRKSGTSSNYTAGGSSGVYVIYKLSRRPIYRQLS